MFELLDAVRVNNYDEVKKLLKNGYPNIDEHCQFGTFHYSSIMFACYTGNKKILKLLLKYGVNMYAKNYGSALIDILIQNHNNHLIKLLIKNGYNLNTELYNGRNILFDVISYRPNTLVKKLLKYGADPNYVDTDGSTPIHVIYEVNISWKNAKKIIKLLMNYGADINTQTFNGGTTPLIGLCESGEYIDIKIAQYLIKKGCNLDLKDWENKTYIDHIEKEKLPRIREAIHKRLRLQNLCLNYIKLNINKFEVRHLLRLNRDLRKKINLVRTVTKKKLEKLL